MGECSLQVRGMRRGQALEGWEAAATTRRQMRLRVGKVVSLVQVQTIPALQRGVALR